VNGLIKMSESKNLMRALGNQLWGGIIKIIDIS
jgi:hypothetical protein